MAVEDDWTDPGEDTDETSAAGEEQYDTGEAGRPSPHATPRTDSPVEAAEGDVVEQYQEVPTEDEYREE